MSGCFPEIVQDFAALPGDIAIDGELVVLDEHGIPQFEQLVRRSMMSRPLAVADGVRKCPAALFAFDVLWCRKKDQRRRALVERKRTLQGLLMKTERVKYAQHVEDGERLHQFAVDLHLEGVMAKRLNSIYQAGRSKDWVKVKTAVGRERERERFARNAL